MPLFGNDNLLGGVETDLNHIHASGRHCERLVVGSAVHEATTSGIVDEYGLIASIAHFDGTILDEYEGVGTFGFIDAVQTSNNLHVVEFHLEHVRDVEMAEGNTNGMTAFDVGGVPFPNVVGDGFGMQYGAEVVNVGGGVVGHQDIVVFVRIIGILGSGVPSEGGTTFGDDDLGGDEPVVGGQGTQTEDKGGGEDRRSVPKRRKRSNSRRCCCCGLWRRQESKRNRRCRCQC